MEWRLTWEGAPPLPSLQALASTALLRVGGAALRLHATVGAREAFLLLLLFWFASGPVSIAKVHTIHIFHET